MPRWNEVGPTLLLVKGNLNAAAHKDFPDDCVLLALRQDFTENYNLIISIILRLSDIYDFQGRSDDCFYYLLCPLGKTKVLTLMFEWYVRMPLLVSVTSFFFHSLFSERSLRFHNVPCQIKHTFYHCDDGSLDASLLYDSIFAHFL